MNKSLILLGVGFIVLVGAGIALSKTNSFRNTSQTQGQGSTDSLGNSDTALVMIDTAHFKMPDYNEEAIAQWQQQMALAQMSPEQRAEYQRQYEMYMQQMQQQEQMIKLQKEYEQKMRANGGIPPVSKKTQSRIEKLKMQFEEKRIKDSVANANKGVKLN